MSKKAQFEPSFLLGVIGAVTALIFLGVVLATSFLTNQKLTNQATDSQAVHGNDSITYANNTNLALSEKRLVTGTVQVWNSSVLVSATGNYTVEYGSDSVGAYLKITNVSGEHLWNSTNATWSVSYSYFYGSQERNISKGSSEGIKVISDFQPTFGTLLAVGIVMLLIIGLVTYLWNKMG